ncbi:MAG: replication factor C small subunit [Candidatus Parvarchaeum acidophilus ARMAN-5]|jgi:replication factor C small subunit|uniref:Replication factor C small subunit n=1 Tax=Candidatus Parvarchaeum acidophilus ARMAN-5 TaxID=662762 RepID=D6GU97_PARA5|nr:MAG: replication factor C small subunit [Candidatus Parvarchaeum acidophilus ARMAN-5]
MDLWVEKYRPQSFDEVIGQKDIVEKLKAMSSKKEIQHMILSGPPGVGKTTCAVVLAKEVFGSTWNQNFIELNASDDRKLSVIQGKVKEFARTKPIDSPFKIILFDEADSLTQEAQQALRRMMEEYSSTCRFLFSVNYQSNIIEPLQSRCAILRFQPLSKTDVTKFIDRIAEKEKLEIDSEAKDALEYVSRGDLRNLVNLMQSLANVSNKIDAKAVLQSSGLMDISKTIEGLKAALAGDFKKSRAIFSEIIDSGINMKELLISIFNVVSTTEIANDKIKNYIFEKLAETDYRIVEGATPFIQFQAFLAFLSSLK